jgi:hypothetical protein
MWSWIHSVSDQSRPKGILVVMSYVPALSLSGEDQVVSEYRCSCSSLIPLQCAKLTNEVPNRVDQRAFCGDEH